MARVERLRCRLAVGEQSPRCALGRKRGSTARPIAPPTWTLVLMKPGRQSQSLSVVPDIARVISDGKPAGSEADQDHRGQEVEDVVRIGGAQASQSSQRR